ncbi:flagellar biosynthesis protein FlgE [Coprothermobacteraceae bacterium]|nr:flagellar biosynthesis protein FlgE [Coprothermobacteraceae bacterium]
MIDVYGAAKASMKLSVAYLDSISYNIANVNTPGFKALLPIEQWGGSTSMPTAKGYRDVTVGSRFSSISDQRLGVLTLPAGHALMNPKAYFVVTDGEARWLVRRGDFVPDVEGHLTLSGLWVLNDKEQLATKEDLESSTLLIVEANTEQYERDSVGFIPRGDEKRLGALEAGLVTGRLEVSNVDLASAMTKLILAQRAYQFSSKAFRNADELIENSINIRGG